MILTFRFQLIVVFMFLFCLPAYAQEQMDYDRTIVIMRFIERYIVAASGVLLLYLGYRLFTTIQDLGSLDAELPNNIKLQLNKVGPGVFFALFGTVLLTYVMSSEIKVSLNETSRNDKGGGLVLGGATPLLDADKLTKILNVRSLDFIDTYVTSDLELTTDEARERLRLSLEATRNIKSVLIDDLIGQGSYEEFLNWQQKISSDPNYENRLSKERLEIIEQVKTLLNGDD